MLENIKETLIKNLFLTTYENEIIELKGNLSSEDKKCMLLLEGESDAYTALLCKHFPETNIEQIISEAITKANNEINPQLLQEYKIAA